MSLRFERPHCSARLSAKADLFHTVMDCPKCGGEVMVPAPEDIKKATDEVKFVCMHCRRKLSATPDLFGTEMACLFRDCGEILVIPDLHGRTIEDGEDSRSDQYLL